MSQYIYNYSIWNLSPAFNPSLQLCTVGAINTAPWGAVRGLSAQEACAETQTGGARGANLLIPRRPLCTRSAVASRKPVPWMPTASAPQAARKARLSKGQQQLKQTKHGAEQRDAGSCRASCSQTEKPWGSREESDRPEYVLKHGVVYHR